MIQITSELTPTHDINAKIQGLVETKKLTLYTKEDSKNGEIPTMNTPWIEPPLLMIEILDERPTGLYDEEGNPIIGMIPIDAIAITKKQEKFIKKHFQWKKPKQAQ